METVRLDAAYEWIPWPGPEKPVPIAPFGDGCNDPVPFSLDGMLALVIPSGPEPSPSLSLGMGLGQSKKKRCSYAQIIQRAQVGEQEAVLVLRVISLR